MPHVDAGPVVAALLAACAFALVLCIDGGSIGALALQASGFTFAVAAMIEPPR